jgi:hypothetical protein
MLRIYLKSPMPTKTVLKRGLLASGILSIILASQLLNPEKINLITCYLKEATGYSCLTCGLSRSFYAASHLHLLESFGFHLMGPIIYFSLLLLFLRFSFEAVARKEVRLKTDPRITKIILVSFSCLWLGFSVIRFLNEL